MWAEMWTVHKNGNRSDNNFDPGHEIACSTVNPISIISEGSEDNKL